MRLQGKHYRIAALWLFVSIISIIKGFFQTIYSTIKGIIRPFHFLLSRLLFLCCINLASFFQLEDRRATASREAMQQLSAKAKEHNKRLRSQKDSGKSGKSSKRLPASSTKYSASTALEPSSKSKKSSKSRLEVMNEQRRQMKSSDIMLDENEDQEKLLELIKLRNNLWS